MATLHSSAFDAHGFTAAPYTTTKEGNTIHLSATCMSPTEAKAPFSMSANCTKAKMEGKNSTGTKMQKSGSTAKETGTN